MKMGVPNSQRSEFSNEVLHSPLPQYKGLQNRWPSTFRLDSEHVKNEDQEAQTDRDTTATAKEGWRRHRRRKIVAMHYVQLYDHRGVSEEAHPLQPFDLKR